MIKVLDTALMQACDRAATEQYRIPGLLLMENAGLQALDAIVEHFGGHAPLSSLVLCGRGNNGGDGLVVARHLHGLGHEVAVVLFGKVAELAGDAALNAQIAAAIGVPILEAQDEAAWTALAAGLSGYDCIVDAMLGTGLRSAPRGVIVLAIESVNAAGVPVIAVDLPSGLSADDGAIPGVAVAADMTVTFAAPKCCHLLAPAERLCGELVVADIGIPRQVMERVEPTLWLVEPGDPRGLLAARVPDSHKGDFGRVLLLAGATGTAGAAVLAAEAALRGGAGLVHVACPQPVYPAIAAQLTEALVHPLPVQEDTGLGTLAGEAFATLRASADVLAVGPGLGTAASTQSLVRRVAIECEQPMVIDADGLNALAGAVDDLRGAAGPRLLTPHPGEAARLLGTDTASVQLDRPAAVRELADRSGAVILLKGHRSLTCAPAGRPVINPSGNPGMASGGSGDVLTGLLVALLAQGLEPPVAAWAGAYLHGLAGDLAAEENGQVGLVAGDLIEWLPTAFAVAVEGALE